MLSIRSKYLPQKKFAYSLIIIGIALGLYAIILFVQGYRSNSQPQPASQSRESSSVKLSKKKIDEYKVADDAPKYIEIPDIGVPRTRIIQLGLMKNNEIAVPSNINDTGWYNRSSKPGNMGAMFIYGHVSSWTADEVFYNLKKLVAGDKVIITRGDNKTYTYKVVSTKVYPYNNVDMSQVLAPINLNKPGLNLMTCTGQIIKGTSEFNERLVVFTSLESS